jgi:beta-glucosidase
MYFRGDPQYAFGHGLSYTTFACADLRTSAPSMAREGAIDVTVDLTNTGSRAGDEVVQLYVRYPESKVGRPLKQLRGFQRVTLAPGRRAPWPFAWRPRTSPTGTSVATPGPP